MVYGAAFAACSNAEHVASLGFNDSKQLTEEKREALYTKKLCEDPLVGYFTDALSASAISQAVSGTGAVRISYPPLPCLPSISLSVRSSYPPLAPHLLSSDSASPVLLSQMLGRSKTSLNQLAVESTARLIQSILDAGVNVAEAYVDTVGTGDIAV